MSSKESGKVRYAYGVAMALLLGGTAFSIASGPVGAQVAQNAPSAMAPRPGAPLSFAELAAQAAAGGGQYLHQAAGSGPHPGRPVRGILPPLRRSAGAAGRPPGPGPGDRSAHPRDGLARIGLHHLARRLRRHQQPSDHRRDRHRHRRHGHRHPDQPQGIYRADRRPRPDVRPRFAQDRSVEPAVRATSATAPAAASATG